MGTFICDDDAIIIIKVEEVKIILLTGAFPYNVHLCAIHLPTYAQHAVQMVIETPSASVN